jgi:hypothetical protein
VTALVDSGPLHTESLGRPTPYPAPPPWVARYARS